MYKSDRFAINIYSVFLHSLVKEIVFPISQSANSLSSCRIRWAAIGRRNSARCQETGDAVVARLAIHVIQVITLGEFTKRLANAGGPVRQEVIKQLLPGSRMHPCSERDYAIQIENHSLWTVVHSNPSTSRVDEHDGTSRISDDNPGSAIPVFRPVAMPRQHHEVYASLTSHVRQFGSCLAPGYSEFEMHARCKCTAGDDSVHELFSPRRPFMLWLIHVERGGNAPACVWPILSPGGYVQGNDLGCGSLGQVNRGSDRGYGDWRAIVRQQDLAQVPGFFAAFRMY